VNTAWKFEFTAWNFFFTRHERDFFSPFSWKLISPVFPWRVTYDIIAITCTQFSYTFLIFHSLVGYRQYCQDCSHEYGTLMKYWDTATNHLMATWKSRTWQEQNMALAFESLHPIARGQEIYYSLSDAKQMFNRMVGPTVLTWISLFAKQILGTSKQTTNFGKAIPYGTLRTFLINQWGRSD